jgi:hypothetical protein
MTWIAGVLGRTQAHVIADLRVAGAKGPIKEFAVAKIRPLAHNQVIGFAGSVPIGLILTHAMGVSLARARIAAPSYHPDEVGSVVPVDLWLETWCEVIDQSYNEVFPSEWREDGLELLLVTVSHDPQGLAHLPSAVGCTFTLPFPGERGVELTHYREAGDVFSIGAGADDERLTEGLAAIAKSMRPECHPYGPVDPAVLPKGLSGVFIESQLQELVHTLLGESGQVGPILVSLVVDVNNSRSVTWNDAASLPPVLSNWPAVSNALRRVANGDTANLDLIGDPGLFLSEDEDAFHRSEMLSRAFDAHWQGINNETIEVNGQAIAIPMGLGRQRRVEGFVLRPQPEGCGLHFYFERNLQTHTNDGPRQATDAFWMNETLVGYLISALSDIQKQLE